MDENCVIYKFSQDRFTSVWYCRTHETKMLNATEIGRHVVNPGLIYLDVENEFNLDEILPAKKENEPITYNFTFDSDINELVIELSLDSEDLDDMEQFEEFKRSLSVAEFQSYCLDVVEHSIENYKRSADISDISNAIFHLQELYTSIEEEDEE